jgi:amino acid adenylation domain-containing protein
MEPLIARPPGAEAPLSPGQQQVWFHDQLAAGAPIYNESVTIHKRGPLDPVILERSINEIIRRHEIWRTAFPMSDGKAVQRIDSNVAVSLPSIDLSQLPVQDREAEAVRIATEDTRRPFDLNVAPLFRMRLVRLAPDYHRIYLTVHHLVFDGVSIYRVLIRELAALYSAYSAGQPSPLPELAVQYRDYAVWKQHQLANGGYAADVKYWRETLSEDLPALELPTDRPRLAERVWRGGMETCSIPAHLIEALKEFGKREGVTPYMLLLAVFQVLLYRYSGQDDIITGGATNTRTRPEFEPLMGYFLNAVVLRSHVEAQLTFREFLGRVKSTVLGAMAHSEIPFDEIVRELAPRRDSARHPLFQVLFSMRPPFADFPDGWDVTDMEVSSGASSFDLFVEFSEHPQALAGRCVYSTELFNRTTIQSLLRHFETLLAGALANPDIPISRLPLLDDSERQRLLVEWNRTDAEFPGERCVHELFEEQVRKTPNAVAVMFEDASLSYAELNRRANRLAHHLRELGVGPDARVAVCLERGLELIVAMLGVLKAGGAYVPLDPAYPDERLRCMLEDCAPVALLTKGHLRPPFASLNETVPVLDMGSATHGWKDHPETDLEAASLGLTSRHLAYVIYTSGSTGTPKGVMVPHRAINRLVLNNGYAKFEASDRVAFASNPAFDAATLEVWAPLLNGGRIVVISQDVLLEPARFGKTLKRQAVTTLWLTVGLFNQYADRLSEEFGNLRYLIVGGDALDPRVIAGVLRSHPPRHLINGYGPTETTTFAITHEIVAVPENARSIPIGRPIANTRIYILDPHGEPVPVGVAGELHIGGAGVARGYLNRPELTAERFVPDPFATGPDARMYKTGDLGKWLPDGTVEFLGRNDFQVKIRGFRVELGEIEARLAEQAGVREAVVLAREDKTGEDKRLVAYYTASEPGQGSVGAEQLRAYLAQKLPEYMLPAAYVRLESLPLTPNGKVDRKALPAPEFGPHDQEELVPPNDDIEERLAKLWQELLGVRSIGVNHNFFELGGHSMLVARLIVQVERTFNRSLSMASVFQRPTIAQLAGLLRQEQAFPEPCRVFPIQPQGTRPPFICLGAGPYFLPLARQLGNDQPLMGVDLDQLKTDALPVPVQLRDIAAHVAGAIREFQPHGPYYLGGWCLYGVLMYEVAQQIMAEGGEVALLVMIDSRYPAYNGTMPLFTRMRAALQKSAYHITLIGRSKAAEIPAYLSQRIRIFHSRAKRFWQEREYIRSIQNLDGPLEMELNPVFLVACTGYEPKPYDGPVVLFQAIERPSGWYWDLRQVWLSLVRGPFETHDVVGGHDGMFKEPYVRVLGSKMKESLAQAQKIQSHQDQGPPLPSSGSAPERLGYSVARSEIA